MRGTAEEFNEPRYFRRIVLPRNATNAYWAVLELRSAQHPNEAKAFENREFACFTATSKLVVTRDSNEWDLSSFELNKAR
jgi:hypothetical protein